MQTNERSPLDRLLRRARGSRKFDWRSVARVPMSSFLLLLAVSMLFLSRTPALAETKVVITFLIQRGSLPTSIRLQPAGGGPPKELKYSASNQKLILTARDFSRLVENFTVTVNYPSEVDTVEFDLRILVPLRDVEERIVFLVQPTRDPLWTATKQAVKLLPNRGKASVPYFVCRQTYIDAKDKVTKVNAAFCWLAANARLVFANPESTDLSVRLYGVDQRAIDEAESILKMPENSDGKVQDEWRKALDRRESYFSDLKTVRDDIMRLRLALWHFFPLREDLRRVHGLESYCKFIAMFREDLTNLSPDQKSRLLQHPFTVTQKALTALEAAPGQPQTCNTNAQN
jgi:hypothetical protein